MIEEETAQMQPQHEFTWQGEKWVLPPVELNNGDKMRFGELIDSKQMMKDMKDHGATDVDCLLPLSVIFFRKEGEEYSEKLMYNGSDRMKLMEDLPMEYALQVSNFYTEHSKFLQDHFPIFQPSRIRQTGRNAKEYYERNGWIDFLITIAKTKAFDIDGSKMNSIDCLRSSSAFDVLLWASIDKQKGEADYLDHEIEMAKHK